MLKKCNNCFKTKPVTEFYRKLKSYQSRCKACNAQVAYVYHNKHRPDKIEKYFERLENET